MDGFDRGSCGGSRGEASLAVPSSGYFEGEAGERMRERDRLLMGLSFLSSVLFVFPGGFPIAIPWRISPQVTITLSILYCMLLCVLYMVVLMKTRRKSKEVTYE